MNIFWREIKTYRGSTLFWTSIFCLIVIVFFMMYSSFSNDVTGLQKTLLHFPVAVRSAFNISMQSFFTIYGYFAYLITFVSLAGAFQAMNLGLGMLAKEDGGKTVDFLLTKPISRNKVITSKLIATVILLILTNIVFSAVSLALAAVFSTTSLNSTTFLLIAATLFMIQIFFLSLGLLLSVVLPKIKSIIAVSLPTVFTFFAIGAFGAIIGDENIRYINPFKYYDSNFIINNKTYDLKFVVVEAILVVAFIWISYLLYSKKDIQAIS